MKVTISEEGRPDWTVELSASSKDLVRLGFNPSMLLDVDVIKTLTAALVTVMEPRPSRHSRLAITAFEEAAMWAVKDVTAAPPDSGTLHVNQGG